MLPNVPPPPPNADGAVDVGAPKVEPNAGAAADVEVPKVEPNAGATDVEVPKVEPNAGGAALAGAPKAEGWPGLVAPNPNAEVETGAVDDPNVFVVDPNPKDPVAEVPAAGAPPKPPPNVGATAFVGAPNVGAAALQREQFIMKFELGISKY